MASKQIIHCQHCFKEFKKQGCYENHIFDCARKNDSFEKKTPTNIELWNMITNLTNKYNDVSKELYNIKNQLSLRAKKVNILKYLNDYHIDNLVNFKETIESITLKEKDLKLVFERGFVDGFAEILDYYLKQVNSGLFLLCFHQKNNTLYVCNSINNELKWQILEHKDWEQIMNKLNIQLFQLFTKYQEENSEDEELGQNMKKIVCANISFEKRCVKIYHSLFKSNAKHFASSFETNYT
tara:strand:+ start:662 stop:1378 length:717 start_codon:yes stop_codon:yes gene_type:complete